MLDVLYLILCVVLPAIVLHEIAHGLMALWFGDTTARDQGRLSINPLKHIDPIGSILVPGTFFLIHSLGMMKSLVLFGWAKPVPVNFQALRNPRVGMIAVALAGPAVNFILAYIFIILYKQPSLHGISFILGWGVLFNLMLAIFNLLPIPPLDGSRIVMSLLPSSLAKMYAKLESVGFVILIILIQFGFLNFLFPLIGRVGNFLGIQI